MFFNNTNCDIYIGTGAGKKLMRDIDNAGHSIKILSPYLSPFLIEKLIRLHHKGINVQLITTDDIEDFYGSWERNIHKLILQEIYVDKEAQALRKKWRTIYKILNYINIGLGISLIVLAFKLQDIRLRFILIPMALLLWIAYAYRSKFRKKRVYHYSYRQLFPFKVYKSYKTDGHSTLLHGKIYIIDDCIVYLGSLNFTGGGTRNNYETRIRITDSDPVYEIRKEFDRLFYEENLPERSVLSWGKTLYREPIN
ncbi:phospholipase D family protein [Sinomicrobium sp. M5D2P9]